MVLTISSSADEVKLGPDSLRISARYLVRSLPAKSFLITAWGREYPS